MSSQSMSRKGLALVMCAVLLWSANFIFIRASNEYIAPGALSLYRWAFASVIALGLAWPYLRKDWPALKSHWRVLFLLAALGMAGNTILLCIGLQTTTAINALLMNSLMPLLTALFAFLFFRERPRKAMVIGIIFAMAGVMWVVIRGDFTVLRNLHFNSGDFWIISGVATYAGYVVVLRRAPQVADLSLNAVTFVLGALCVVPFFLWEYWSGARTVWEQPIVWGAIAYTAIGTSVITFICFNMSVRLLGATRASSFLLLTPFFGTIFAILFLGEELMLAQVVGAALIFFGLYIGRR